MKQLKLGVPILIYGQVSDVKGFLFSLLVDVQKNGCIKKILFVDTLNCINPYEIAVSEPDQHGYYRNIYCVRTERPYDLWAMLSTCEKFIKLRKIEALFIPSLTYLFRDSDKDEIRPVLCHILSKVRYLTNKYKLLTLIGNSPAEDENIKNASSYLSQKQGENVCLALT